MSASFKTKFLAIGVVFLLSACSASSASNGGSQSPAASGNTASKCTFEGGATARVFLKKVSVDEYIQGSLRATATTGSNSKLTFPAGQTTTVSYEISANLVDVIDLIVEKASAEFGSMNERTKTQKITEDGVWELPGEKRTVDFEAGVHGIGLEVSVNRYDSNCKVVTTTGYAKAPDESGKSMFKKYVRSESGLRIPI